MVLETFDSESIKVRETEIHEKMEKLKGSFHSSIEPEGDVYINLSEYTDTTIQKWAEVKNEDIIDEGLSVQYLTFSQISRMYDGIMLENGEQTVGLARVHEWKINEDYKYSNLKAHAGYGAEIAGTAKENIQALHEGTGITTYRADDRPDLYPKNDQYVDKIRVNKDGEVIERIQVKFIGKNAAECYYKLKSKSFEKYLEDGRIDKMEVPKDYYDDIKSLIHEDLSKLNRELEHLKSDGKDDLAEIKEKQIRNLMRLDEILECSTVTSVEAIEAVKHPKRYTAKLFAEDYLSETRKARMGKSEIDEAVNSAVGFIDSISPYAQESILTQYSILDIDDNLEFQNSSVFISTEVAMSMSESNQQLLQSLSELGISSYDINLSIEACDSAIDFGSGIIESEQLEYDLKDIFSDLESSKEYKNNPISTNDYLKDEDSYNNIQLIKDMSGLIIASEAYLSLVSFGDDYSDILADKAQEMADKTLNETKIVNPSGVEYIKTSINEYALQNSIPISV